MRLMNFFLYSSRARFVKLSMRCKIIYFARLSHVYDNAFRLNAGSELEEIVTCILPHDRRISICRITRYGLPVILDTSLQYSSITSLAATL